MQSSKPVKVTKQATYAISSLHFLGTEAVEHEDYWNEGPNEYNEGQIQLRDETLELV